MKQEDRIKIVELIKREVVPAIGCTEPIAVALCVAKATEELGSLPTHIDVYLSANMLKNAMGVGIPGTQEIGLPMAVALGATIGESSLGLEVLKQTTSSAVEAAHQYLVESQIRIQLKAEACDKLYIEVHAKNETDVVEAIISGQHTHFIYLAKNGVELLNQEKTCLQGDFGQEVELTLERIYEFATTAPFAELEFILEAATLNKQAAQEAFSQNYGHSIGKMLLMGSQHNLLGDSIYTKALSYTSAACDARMSGAMVTVMSNSGSGNQGISATLPIVIYAQEQNKSKEELARALILSHLTAIYIKQSLGRLSALCGCVVAATGASCGITYLMGGGYKEISYATQNMIANITGMLCDGAKPSCSMKVATGVSTAILSAMMAMEGKSATSAEGIIDADVDQTIRNLTRIGSSGMLEADKVVLDIMTHKTK